MFWTEIQDIVTKNSNNFKLPIASFRMSLYALSESCYDFFFLFVCLSLTKLLELYQKDEVALFKHV